MSTDRDTTRIVRLWLRTDEQESADRVLDAVLDRLDTTPQRRTTWWPARRFPEMNNTAKVTLAAAAVVVAALLGIQFLGPGMSIGGPEPTPEPTATPVALPATGPLDPGTYYVAEGTSASWAIPSATGRFTFDVPAVGWAASNVFVDKHHDGPDAVSLSTWIVSHVSPMHAIGRGPLSMSERRWMSSRAR